MLEAEAHQHFGGAGFGGPGVDVEQARMDLADPVRIGRGLGFRHQRVAFGVGLQHDVHDRLIRGRDFLRDPAEAGAVLQPDRAVLARFCDLLANEAQQGRLAGAVAPHHADFPAGGDARRRGFKQRARFHAVVEIADFEHGRPLPARRGKDTLKALQYYISAMLCPRPIPAMLRCNNSTMDNRSFPIHLDSGEAVLVRPIGRHDADRMRAGIAALSDHSRYLRFFNGGQTMPEHVIERLCDADGWKHVAWGAIDLSSPSEPAIGAVHAIRRGTSREAELALAVLDDWHGKGLARLLLTGVIADARRAGITHLTAETFAENRATRQLFRGLGGLSVHRDGPVVSYRFDIETAAQKLEGLTQNAAGDLIRSGLNQTAPAQDLAPVRLRRSV